MKDVFFRKRKKVHWVHHKLIYYMYTNGSEKLWMVTLGKQEDFSYKKWSSLSQEDPSSPMLCFKLWNRRRCNNPKQHNLMVLLTYCYHVCVHDCRHTHTCVEVRQQLSVAISLLLCVDINSSALHGNHFTSWPISSAPTMALFYLGWLD